MGLYADRVLPRVLDKACGMASLAPLRERVCAGLHGQVVEVGFGSGHNVPHYPAAVTRVFAIEPADAAWALAGPRLAAARIPVERTGLDGQSLPLADDSCDTALSTWTLCTIPDAVTALREIRRVLRPGGSLHFIEHGRSTDEGVRRWQNRLNGVQNRIACGCNINRDIPALIAEGGLSVDRLDTYYTKGEPRILGWTFEGTASAPA